MGLDVHAAADHYAQRGFVTTQLDSLVRLGAPRVASGR